MQQFWVDFSASMLIDAENEEQAKQKFFEDFPIHADFIEVNGVEKAYSEDDE